jgi:hypothetical protein
LGDGSCSWQGGFDLIRKNLIAATAPCTLFTNLGPTMTRTRDYIEKLLFPGPHGQRRRHMRFFLLALLLAILVCIGIGVILFALNYRAKP